MRYFWLLLALCPVLGHGASFTEREARCLTATGYHEARGEDQQGRLHTLMTVVVRVFDPRWPSDTCAVVRQPAQFSWWQAHRTMTVRPPNPIEREALAEIRTLAEFLAHGGWALLDPDLRSLTHYHSTRVHPGWGRRLQARGARIKAVGRHRYYVERKAVTAPVTAAVRTALRWLAASRPLTVTLAVEAVRRGLCHVQNANPRVPHWLGRGVCGPNLRGLRGRRQVDARFRSRDPGGGCLALPAAVARATTPGSGVGQGGPNPASGCLTT